MSKKVVIVDYGLGNLLSVARAFQYCGADVIFTDSHSVIKQADRLVLPGVGAFPVGMAELQSRCLIDPLCEYSRTERPFLGICLGMQMMLEKSEEFGMQDGLGFIPGVVKAIPNVNQAGVSHKVPHIGWNNLIASEKATSWNKTILKNIAEGESVYFVHSYMAVPTEKQHRLADCDYNDVTISAVIHSGSLYGCQFHPEKSGKIGLKIIEDFLQF